MSAVAVGAGRSSPPVRLAMLDAQVAEIVVDRPERHNAMNAGMYQALLEAVAACRANVAVRCVLLRGAGGKSFVAGTDIAHFADFQDGEDGVRYEQFVESVVDAVERIGVPTIAVIDGWAVGGGLALATACDFRVCTPASRFGAPIAKTLSNTLSARNIARLCSAFGVPRVKRMLMLADCLPAPEALDCGYVTAVHSQEELQPAAHALARRLVPLSQVTQAAVKESLRRLVVEQQLGDEDLVRQVYGSAEFHARVQSYLAG